jgi:hypothetical protein
VDSGEITAEAAQDAAHTQTGDIWQDAVAMSQGDRAVGNMASFVAGVGFKIRSESDKQIDEFYNTYFGLWGMKDNLSPDDFNEGMRQLREQFPWMDELLISRKPTNERDGALAYSVMSRIPPGQKSDFAKMVDIDDLMDKFYNDKGDLSTWTPSDKDRFMAGIIDLSAVLAMPDDAIQREYYQAGDAYKAMTTEMQKNFGDAILDGIDAYYLLQGSERSAYMKMHPEVQQAFDFKNQYVLTNPVLNKYYGGISVLEQYYTSQMYSILGKEFGDDIQAKWDEYDNLQLTNTKAAATYKRQHPEMAAYTKRKNELEDNMTRLIVKLGSNFPDEPQVPIRRDINAPSNRQKELIAASQPEQTLQWSDWQMLLSQPMQALILDYWQSGDKLPSSATYQLDYIAKSMGMYDSDEVLRAIGIALQKAQQ